MPANFRQDRWTLTGLRAGSITQGIGKHSLPVLHFCLQATDGISSTHQDVTGDCGLRDLGPPATIQTLFVSAIDVELQVSYVDRFRQNTVVHEQVNNNLTDDTRDERHDGEARNYQLTDSTSHLYSSKYARIAKHRTSIDEITTQATAALEYFFFSKPKARSTIWQPRIFLSSSLSELAPGVFLPEYPRLVQQRQRLLSPVAKVLAQYSSRQKSLENETSKSEIGSSRVVSTKAWFEGLLWSCMICKLRMPRRVKRRASLIDPPAVREQFSGVMESTSTDGMPKDETQDFTPQLCDWMTLDSIQTKDFDSLLLLSSDEETEAQLLQSSTADSSEGELYPGFAEGTVTRDIHTTTKSLHENGTTKANHVHEFLDQSCAHGRGLPLVIKDAMRDHVFGSSLLTHHVDPTYPGSDREADWAIEEHATACDQSDLGEGEFLLSTEHDGGTPELEQLPLPFDLLDTTDHDSSPFTTAETHFEPPQRGSIGSDHSHSNIQRWRRSQAPSNFAGLYEIHDMLKDDIGPTLKRSNEQNDEMLDIDSRIFETFNYSRQPSQPTYSFSPSITLVSDDTEEFDDARLLCSQSTQATTPSHTSTGSSQGYKKHINRPSILTTFTSSSTISNAGIYFDNQVLQEALT